MLESASNADNDWKDLENLKKVFKTVEHERK